MKIAVRLVVRVRLRVAALPTKFSALRITQLHTTKLMKLEIHSTSYALR